MECPRTVIFDLDDTLAESFQAPPSETLEGLKKLLNTIPIAIMTGATFQRMEQQFLSVFEDHPKADRLYIFPVCSAQAYAYGHKKWQLLYNLALSGEERSHIQKTITETVATLPALDGIQNYGTRMVDKGSQVAYTHVGIDASSEVKKSWDPDGSKRTALWSALKRSLPEFEVLMGGTTTIDVTKKGVNKSHGVTWLSERLGIPAREMLYVGDALYEGGNDAAVIPTGIETRAVAGPEETKQIIDELISVYST